MGKSELVADPILERASLVEGYKVLGGVVLHQKLGQGGMGAVYRGKHLRLGVDVALKVMAPPDGMSPTQADNFIQRFVREAKAAAAIKHHNLIRVYDVDVDKGIYFLIMDFVDGESAGDRLKRKGKFGEQEAVEIALGAAEGLGHAHRKGIVHRDVKPDNILVDKEGNVVVADLGLAKAYGGGQTDSALSMGLSMTQQAMGTPFYMSPEQTRSAKDVGPRADVWSLGVTLYQLMTDNLPWRDTDLSDLIQRIRNDPVPDVKTHCPGASADLCGIIEKSLRKDPEARYPDCAEMADALAEHLDTIRTSRKSVLPDTDAGCTKMALMSVTPPPANTMTLIGKSILGVKAAQRQAVQSLPDSVAALKAASTPVTEAVVGSASDDLTMAFESRRRRWTRGRGLLFALGAGGLALAAAILLAVLLGRGSSRPEEGREPTVSLETEARLLLDRVTAAVEENRLEEAAALLEGAGARYDSTVYGIRMARLSQTVTVKMDAKREAEEKARREAEAARAAAEEAERKGDLEGAVRVLKAALERRDDADLRERLAKLERAVAALRLIEEASTLERDGRLDEAKAVYERALPDAMGESRRRAMERLEGLRRRMRAEEAIARIKRAVEENSWRPAWGLIEEARTEGVEDTRLDDLSRRVVDALAPPRGLTGPLGLKLLLVPGGEYRMGSEDGRSNERPVHRVAVSPFYIGRFEVTAAQLDAFHGKRVELPAKLGKEDMLPAVGVTWQEASLFCEYISTIDAGGGARGSPDYRLPTEAEWEYAARGGNGRRYPWGNEPPTHERANLAGAADGFAGLASVGSFPKGNTPLGVSDLIGNAAEWCGDWYGDYESAPQRDPSGPRAGKYRAVRGSAFAYEARTWSRASARGVAPPGKAADTMGFRAVRELTAEEKAYLKLREEIAGNEGN